MPKAAPLASARMRANRDAVGRWSKRAMLAALAVATYATSASLREARADEPVAASEPRLMSESGEATTVIDAFDKDDPFDLNLTLGFTQRWKSANIRRETSLNQP